MYPHIKHLTAIQTCCGDILNEFQCATRQNFVSRQRIRAGEAGIEVFSIVNDRHAEGRAVSAFGLEGAGRRERRNGDSGHIRTAGLR